MFLSRSRPTLGVLLLVSGLAMANVDSNDADDKRQRLKVLRQEIADIRQKLEHTEGERQNELELLRKTEVEINHLQQQLDQHQGRHRQLQQQLESLYQQQSILREDMQRSRQVLANMVQATYMMGNDNVIKILLNQENPEQISRMLEYYQYLSRYRANKIQHLLNTASDLDSVEQDIQDTVLENEKVMLGRKQAQQALRQQNLQRNDLIAHLNTEIFSGNKRVKKLKADEQQLLKLLQELTTLNRHELAIGSQSGFGKMKGKLQLPLDAPIKAAYGTSKGQGDLVWNGVLMKTLEGKEISAIYQGQVIFADFFRGFGLLLILDHGDGYMSLYSHTQQILKQVGDWVDTRDIIAISGASGGLSEPGLYFEIRVNGKPSDPLVWCRR